MTLRIVDVGDESGFRRIPPCADPRFDHRTCDYWEDADRGSRDARSSWLSAPAAPAGRQPRRVPADNPFAPPPPDPTSNPFAAGTRAAATLDLFADEAVDAPAVNPFQALTTAERPLSAGVPRKLALLDRGRGVFGSYAKVVLDEDEPVAYAQFGPLSAYPRALRIRELYPRLPTSPPPAVITCIATATVARHRGHARNLVRAVCEDLAARGFAAVESYPDLSQAEDATSAARPGFWEACGFERVVDDARFPVVRRELG